MHTLILFKVYVLLQNGGSMKKSNIQAVITKDDEVIDVSQDGKRVFVADEDERVITQKQIEHLAKERQGRDDFTDFVWVKFQYNQPLYDCPSCCCYRRV